MIASRILMVSTNRACAPQPTVPIGAAWVAEALHLAGFDVRFLDLCFAKTPLRLIDDVLREFQPDGIGISIRNLDNCDFLSPKSFLPEVKQITDFIKGRSGARILLGGAGVSIMPMQVLEFLDLEYAVVGEGERAAVLFFQCDDEKDASRVPGVVRRGEKQNHAVCTAPPLPEISVMPRMHHWVDTGSYLRLEPVLPVQGKRGCANRCLYCTYNRIEGFAWRLRDPALVVEEITMAMAKTGAREFEFVDSVFNQPDGYLETLMEAILRHPLRARFRVSSLSPKGLTLAQVRLMERAGMASLVITPESAADVTLAALNKDFTEEDINHSAELLARSDIKALWCFLLGGPEEDEKTLAKTIGFLNRNLGKKDGAFLTTGIRIYPGTGLHELALREGMVDRSDPLLLPSFYFSPKITPQQARDALQKGVSHLPRCIFLSDTGQSSHSTLRRMGTMLKISNPLWHYAGLMNKINGRSRIICRNWPTNQTHEK